jgi:flagellar hook-associated protein 3 FlgL
MKSSFVSSASISEAVRHSVMRAQIELTKAQKEVSTGRVADVGLALGARTGQSVSFSRDFARLQGIVDTNALASARLSSTQAALNEVTTIAQSFLATITNSLGGDASPLLTLTDAKGTLQALTTTLNTSYNGEHLFAGINTDVKPVNDYTAAGSPNKAAFDAAFLAHFGFTQSDPGAASMSAAQMDTFIDSVVIPEFMGAGWQATWSNATDEGINSRIALNETVETSVSANEQGLRKLAMAAATVLDMFETTSQVSDPARKQLLSRAVAFVGEAMASIANLSAKTGIIENRVKNASERINTQTMLLEKNIQDFEGVDPYQASTKVSTLLQQIETSYALTARIQQLSLVKFLT